MAERMMDTTDTADMAMTVLGTPTAGIAMTKVDIRPDGSVNPDDVAPLRTRRGEIASWRIHNDSPFEQTVRVRNFRRKVGSSHDPVDPDVERPFSEVRVPPNGSDYIRGRVAAPGGNDRRTYEYEIEVRPGTGGAGQNIVVDPDYEIWP